MLPLGLNDEQLEEEEEEEAFDLSEYELGN